MIADVYVEIKDGDNSITFFSLKREYKESQVDYKQQYHQQQYHLSARTVACCNQVPGLPFLPFARFVDVLEIIVWDDRAVLLKSHCRACDRIT